MNASFAVLATYVHQASDGTSYVITSEPTNFDTNATVSMTTISESNASLVSSSETVGTTGIPLEQFAAHAHQVDPDDHSTLFVLQEDSGGADQDVRVDLSDFSVYVETTI